MVVTGGRNGRRHGDGRRRQAAVATMHARLFQRLIPFLLLSNEVAGDNDVERGAGIFCKIIIVCFLSSDIDHTVCITRWQAHHHHQLVFYKNRDDKFANY